MDLIFPTLEGIITNAKKSLGRPYARETIESKKKEISELQKNFERFIVELNLTQQETSSLTKRLK